MQERLGCVGSFVRLFAVAAVPVSGAVVVDVADLHVAARFTLARNTTQKTAHANYTTFVYSLARTRKKKKPTNSGGKKYFSPRLTIQKWDWIDWSENAATLRG